MEPNIESKQVSSHVNDYLQKHANVANKLTERENIWKLGSDLFAFVTEFLTNKELLFLSLVCRSWLGSVHELQDFVRNQICIIIDNTASMDQERQKLQKEFLESFLQNLNPYAIVAVRFVNPDVKENWAEIVPKQGLAKSLLKILSSLLIPDFYCANQTPLFQSICDAVTEGFKILLCLTDGFDTQNKKSKDLVIFSRSFLDTYVEMQGKMKGESKRLTLTSFMQALLQIVPGNQVFLPALVGLNMMEYDFKERPKGLPKGLLPIYSLKSSDQIKIQANMIRRDVVPREAGGGRQTKAAVILQDRRYHNVPDRLKRFFRLGWLCFPEATNVHCISLLTAYRHLTLDINVKDPLWTRWLPLLTQAQQNKSKGWYFRYAKAAYSIALEELKKTRDAALVAFSSLNPLIFSHLIQATREYNWNRYEEYIKQHPSQRSHKRKRVDLEVKEKPNVPPLRILTKTDFEKIIGPPTLESSELKKMIPANCYLVSVATYFWLIEKDSTKEIFLDRLLRKMNGEER